MFERLCSCVQAEACGSLQRSDMDVGLPQLLSTLFFEGRSLTKVEVHLFG